MAHRRWIGRLLRVCVALGCGGWLLSAVIAQPLAGLPNLTPTATVCPIPTPEILGVAPVTSPTLLSDQPVTVSIDNGEAVTVTTQFAAFTVLGDFNAGAHPAVVAVELQPDTLHELTVYGRVREIWQNGCRYGGYTLSTRHDWDGRPLLIEQRTPASRFWLPIVFD